MILYFLPGVIAWQPELAAKFKLERVLDGKPSSREVSNGPGGSSGLLIADRSVPPTQVQYLRDKQRWQRRHASEAWMGFDPDSPPGPLQLERTHQIEGVTMQLADGRHYTIPQLRQFDRATDSESLQFICTLEQMIEIDAGSGRLIHGRVVDRYAAIWETCCQISDAIDSQITSGKSSAELPDGTTQQFAGDLLNLNYRVEMPEIVMLGLLTTRTLPRITQIGLDLDTLRRNLGNVLCRIAASGTLNTESGVTPPTAD